MGLITNNNGFSKGVCSALQDKIGPTARNQEDAKKREAELRARAEAAEAALSGALAKAERSEAAAKSMEAAYDVMAEAADDGKKRVASLQEQLEALEAKVGGGDVSAG